MYRIAMEKLLKWKESKRRKPLIIEGARQVGKTWLMKEFGRLYYTDTVYINFDSNSRMAELFASDLDTERLTMGLELYSGRKIDPDHTLLIFDEVQEVPRALSSLKYFYENAPEYHIVCAGSLLGIALHEGTSFPVGKVDFLKLYPLSFREFLMANGKRGLYTMGQSYRGNIEGSDPKHSFHYLGGDDTLYVFEAPIDLLSYISLFPEGWQEHNYVACCGTSSIPVLEMLRQLPQLRQVYLCLDNDAAGHAASERMGKLLEERGISAERLVPQQKDWNDDLKAEQENKMERSELCQTFC